MNSPVPNQECNFDPGGDEPQETIIAAQMGSVEAFSDIVRLHQRSVRAFILRYTDSHEAADEIAQEVFLAAFRNLSTWKGQGKLISWILGIARNHILTWLRQKRRETVSLDAVLHELHFEQLQETKVSSLAEEARVQALRDCIQVLPSRQRKVLIQHYYESRTAVELAEEHQRTAGNVRMLLLRVRRALRTCIEQKTGEPC